MKSLISRSIIGGLRASRGQGFEMTDCVNRDHAGRRLSQSVVQENRFNHFLYSAVPLEFMLRASPNTLGCHILCGNLLLSEYFRTSAY